MTRRVSELAKEWGLEPKDLTTRLEKIGLRNKRAASSLSDEEVLRAANELGLGDKPQITIGGERVVELVRPDSNWLSAGSAPR